MKGHQRGDSDRSLLYRVQVVHAVPFVPVFLVSLFAAVSIRDNSFLWHIKAGAVQFVSGSVLQADVFSATEFGSPWRTQSWLADLLYYGLESVSSTLLWANWLAVLVALLTLFLMGIGVYRSVPSPFTTGLVLVPAVWLIGPFVVQRPVSMSLTLLAALVVVLQNRDRVLWLVVPIIWIWAGVHGSWVIGGMFVILEWLRTSDRRVFRAGVLALISTLATAHGIGTWLIVVDFVGAREALSLMQEWKVPNFGSALQMPYLLLIAGVLAAAVRGKLTLRDLILLLPVIAFGTLARRTVVPAMIILLPWAAMALTAVKVPRSNSPPALAVGMVMAILAIGLSPMLTATGDLDRHRFPTDDIMATIEGTNPFHDDAVGGFLIYSGWSDNLVWVDDRAELHGIGRLSELRRALDGEYKGVFDHYGFDAALVERDWTLADRLIADGWSVKYESGDFLVLAP